MKKSLLGIFMLITLGFFGWAASQTFIAANPSLPLESPLGKPATYKPSEKVPYRFIAFGDWGAGTPFQKDLAAQMTKTYEKTPFDSAILLGDNIYPDGNVRKYGKSYFTDMYASLIKAGVEFIVAIGNHDVVHGYQSDQLAFFHMPGYYYAVHKPGLDFFVLDTNNFARSDVQQKWLAKALKESKTNWKVVVGHHPIYTSGEHGINNGLKKTLEPILIKNHVQLYLAGHDHDYERFKPVQGVQHIVSGGGGAYLRDFERVLPASEVRHKAHHFLLFDLKDNTLHMQVIDKTGKVIDEASWKCAMAPTGIKKDAAS